MQPNCAIYRCDDSSFIQLHWTSEGLESDRFSTETPDDTYNMLGYKQIMFSKLYDDMTSVDIKSYTLELVDDKNVIELPPEKLVAIVKHILAEEFGQEV